jgi:hypothetical protein
MFIHGVKEWNRSCRVGTFRSLEISISYHIPGRTVPFRPYGYVLEIISLKGLRLFPHDISSLLISGRKVYRPGLKRRQVYSLEELIKQTPKASHNEILTRVDNINLIGYYISETGANGSRIFARVCEQAGLQREEI